MADLVNDALRTQSSTFQPIGYQTFAKSLADGNVPETLILNKERRELIRDFKTGKTSLDSVTPERPSRPRTRNRPVGTRSRMHSRNALVWESMT